MNLMKKFMKKIFFSLIFLTFLILPWHALLVTLFQCKIGWDVAILRFWKEGMIVLLLIGWWIHIIRKKLLWDSIQKNQTLMLYIFLYIFVSAIYIYAPHFFPEVSSYLGFRYNVFFLLAFLAGYIVEITNTQLKKLLRGLLITTNIIMVWFLTWYIFFDIWTTVDIFGFSSHLSTFSPQECLSFSQNTSGHHRLQATFWWPIRYSVYLVIIYFITLGAFMDEQIHKKKKYSIIVLETIWVLLSVFFSYTKTSFIGFLLWGIVFLYVIRKISQKHIFFKKYLYYIIMVSVLIGGIWMYVYRDLFLHIWSLVQRFENLIFSFELLRNNIFWYWLGIAGPASMVSNSSNYFSPFLPENWYVQVWLETGIVWLFLFLGILWLIGKGLYVSLLRQKKYYLVGLFCALVSLCIMAFFTHSFEEAATSYILFFLIGMQFKNNT